MWGEKKALPAGLLILLYFLTSGDPQKRSACPLNVALQTAALFICDRISCSQENET